MSGSRHNASSGAPRPTRRTPFKRSIAGRRIAAQDQAEPIVLDRRRLLVEELRAQHRGDRMVLGPAHRRQAAALPGDARIVHEQSELGLGNGTSAPPQHSYEGLNTPSVWRSARSQAAAKVDALASNGMDEIEIPAFLRKQAD